MLMRNIYATKYFFKKNSKSWTCYANTVQISTVASGSNLVDSINSRILEQIFR